VCLPARILRMRVVDCSDGASAAADAAGADGDAIASPGIPTPRGNSVCCMNI